jgi:tRNA (mo5U34)-methyltransferase
MEKNVAHLQAMQERIDAITWYHEFDFGNGLRARSNAPDVEAHRHSWQFIERNLDAVSFQGKDVLDIGCWDGYWSFYAERRGARSVLATDDCTQNWSRSGGILLAKELYGSSVKVNLNVPVYEVASLRQKFDIILFLGVYYHLFDPFYALAQIRQCCHPGTLVLVDGPVALGLLPATTLVNFANRSCEWMPTIEALSQLLRATYFSIMPTEVGQRAERPTGLGKRWRLRMCAALLKQSRADVLALARELEPPVTANKRVFLTCVPFEGPNDLYNYRPPFGLHEYDPRFRHDS